jgi:hypothetical protein
MKAPKHLGLERNDEILSIDVVRELGLLKLKLQIPPRYLTDMLSCLKINGRARRGILPNSLRTSWGRAIH